MPTSIRILVVDSDITSQGDVQQLLVSHRYIVAGCTGPGEESVTMARAFQPNVVLLNLDNGRESYGLADQVATEFPEARLIAYSHSSDIQSEVQGARVSLGARPVRMVSADENALLAEVESALAGPQEQAPVAPDSEPQEPETIAADNEHEERAPHPRAASPDQVAWSDARVALSGGSAEPFLWRVAQLSSEWLLTRSPHAEERMMSILAEDVQAPCFGGRGRDVVRQGLEALAQRLGVGFRLVPGEMVGEPVLAVVVETRDGQWHRAGHFVVRAVDGNTVSYFDYRDDEPSADGERAPTGHEEASS